MPNAQNRYCTDMRRPEVVEVVGRHAARLAQVEHDPDQRHRQQRRGEAADVDQPVGAAHRLIGVNDRARSKPTIEAGPPVGGERRPGRPAATAAPGCRAAAPPSTATIITGTTRDHDPRAVVRGTGRPSQLSASPLRITHTVMTISSVLAVARDSPWPRTRNGKPHSIAKTVIENCDVKWVHIPSRVPGLPQTVCTCRASARSLILRRTVAGVRRVLDQQRHRDHQHHPDRRRERERAGPAELLASAHESGAAARIAPSLADLPGQLGHQRRLPDQEPRRHQPDHADEDHRVAGPDHRAGQHGAPGRTPRTRTAAGRPVISTRPTSSSAREP